MYPSGVQSCIPSSWDGAITEEECTRELACCWDPKSPINCYKPKIHLGTTIGAAVAGTIVGCICFALGGCKLHFIIYIISPFLRLGISIWIMWRILDIGGWYCESKCIKKLL